MPAHIVFDYSHRQVRSTLARGVSVLLGAVLVTIGLLATAVVVPTGFVTIGDILVTWQNEPSPFDPGFPLREIELAFAVSLVTAIAGIRYGRRLVRGRRAMVLFLRRFGYRGSMQAVTFAVIHTIGSNFRLVTLDDEAIAPLGVTTMSKVVFGAGERLMRAARAAAAFIFGGFQWVVWAMWAVVAVQAALIALSPDWRRAFDDGGTVDGYVEVISSVMEGRVPLSSIDLSLRGAFAILLTGLALMLGAMLAMGAVLLISLPFIGVLVFASSSADALRKAEEAKSQSIGETRDVAIAARTIAHQGRQTFAPRLVVLRVAGHVWQQTVSALAAMSAASIIDVSEPTEHLLWEIQELERVAPGRWIVVGEHAQIGRWGETPPPEADEMQRRFAAWLDGRTILAYTTDRAGMRRFSRALHGMLLDVDDGPD